MIMFVQIADPGWAMHYSKILFRHHAIWTQAGRRRMVNFDTLYDDIFVPAITPVAERRGPGTAPHREGVPHRRH
jgi:hypothetical protein